MVIRRAISLPLSVWPAMFMTPCIHIISLILYTAHDINVKVKFQRPNLEKWGWERRVLCRKWKSALETIKYKLLEKSIKSSTKCIGLLISVENNATAWNEEFRLFRQELEEKEKEKVLCVMINMPFINEFNNKEPSNTVQF